MALANQHHRALPSYEDAMDVWDGLKEQPRLPKEHFHTISSLDTTVWRMGASSDPRHPLAELSIRADLREIGRHAASIDARMEATAGDVEKLRDAIAGLCVSRGAASTRRRGRLSSRSQSALPIYK